MRYLSVERIGPFVLDYENRRLLKDGVELRIRPKTFEVLSILVRAHGKVVLKEDLLRTVWPDVHVSDTVLKVCIRELRQLFAEDIRNPRYIATAHSRGYRFLAPVDSESDPGSDNNALDHPEDAAYDAPSRVTRPFIGRKPELQRLMDAFAQACAGHRSTMFVVGEAGIGKSWLATALMKKIASMAKRHENPWILQGQCFEQHGLTEAYQPILDAIARLDGDLPGLVLGEHLAKHAPSLLAQLPSLQRPGDAERLSRQTLGASPGRVVREAIAFFDALSRMAPLVLIIEDLHFADEMSLDLLMALCKRSDPARLCALFFCRPNPSSATAPGLSRMRHELVAYSHCSELRLGAFELQEVRAYLEMLFSRSAFVPALGEQLFSSTQGHPLFLAMQVESLVLQGYITQDEKTGIWICKSDLLGSPLEMAESIRSLILGQADALPSAELEVLEAMSIAGEWFSAEHGAAMLNCPVLELESTAERLVRHGLFTVREWLEGPGTDRTSAYRLRHGLQRYALYERIAPARRASLHLRLAEALEQGPFRGLDALAAVLAHHFEQGKAFRRAAQWLYQLALIDWRRFSRSTAIEHLKRAIELLSHEKQGPDLALETEIYRALAHASALTVDIPHTLQTLLQLKNLALMHGDIEAVVTALHELIMYHWQDAPQAVALAKEAAQRAEEQASASTCLVAHGYLSLCRALLHRCAPDDPAAVEEGLQASAQSGSLWTKLGYHGLTMLVYLNSNPQIALKIAQGMKTDALSLGMESHYIGAVTGVLIARLRLAQWEGLSTALCEFEEECKRWDNQGAAFNIHLVRSMYLFEARDFQAAFHQTDASLPKMRDLMPPPYIGHLMVRVARCRLELLDVQSAEELYAQAPSVEKSFFWYLADAFELESGVEFALRKEDFERAERYIQLLHEQAWGYKDEDWLLRSRTLQLKLYAHQARWSEAEREIETAAAEPLEIWHVAAWNFHETAARIFLSQRKENEAQQHLEFRDAAVNRLLAQVHDQPGIYDALVKAKNRALVPFTT